MLPEAQKEILFRRQDLRQLGKAENRINMGPGWWGSRHGYQGTEPAFPQEGREMATDRRLWKSTLGSISFPFLTTEAGSSFKG